MPKKKLVSEKAVKKTGSNKAAPRMGTKPNGPPPDPRIPLPGEDYKLKLPTGYLSHSQVELYLQCPIKYYYRYILQHKEPYNANLAEGSIVARLAEISNLKFLEIGRHLTKGQANGIVRVIAKEELDKVENWAGQDKDRIIARQLEFIRVWYGGEGPDWEPVLMPDKKPGVEWKFEIEVAGVPVNGVIDLVQKTMVTDMKCSYKPENYNAKLSLQLALYMHAAQKTQGRFDLFHKGDEAFERLPKTVKKLPRIKRWLEITYSNVAQAISAGIFPPCSPQHTKYCDKNYCFAFGSCYGK